MKNNKKPEDKYRLYVIVANDIQDMTPGKAEAHSGHAASSCAFCMGDDPRYRSWCGLRGFGTQINLDARSSDFPKIEDSCLSSGAPYGFVDDPSYPIRSPLSLLGIGDKAQYVPKRTAMWVMVDMNDDHQLSVVRDYRTKP